MIATARVLRVRARTPGDLTKATRAVVQYAQGGQPEATDPLSRYYGRGQARGRARGAAAGLVGLRADIPESALSRVLQGQHAITGLPLLTASRSAGRAARINPAATSQTRTGGSADTSAPTAKGLAADGADAGRRGAPGVEDDWLTLAEAADVAGVTATYLRRLVSQAASGTEAQTKAPPADATGTSANGLSGQRGPDGRWWVRRSELAVWSARRTPPATVLGYDIVCAAPKSVSLLWAFGDEALRADVGASLDAAVDATIGYLERHAAFGQVRGHNRRAVGLAVASYLHDVSRNDEAHLHIHNIVVNAVAVPADPPDETADPSRPPGAGGWEWRAVDGEMLLAQIKTAGYVGAAVLRHELSARRGVVWEPARSGVAEIAAFPAELLAAFSTRHGEVVAEFTQLVAQGLEPSGRTAAVAQRESRAPKKVLADEQVAAVQLARLTTAGWTPERVRQLAPPLPHPPEPKRLAQIGAGDVAALFELLAGAAGLTAHKTTFVRRDVVQQVAAWVGNRCDAVQIEQLADRFLADRRVVLLHDTTRRRRRHEPEPVYTVESLLVSEDTLLGLCRQGQVTEGAPPRLLVDEETVTAHLAAATNPPLPGSAVADAGSVAGGPALSGEQAELLRRLLTSGDLVRPAVGAAGTGKTEAMRVLTGILHAAGRHVFATAHGGRQAEQLADRINIPARVVASWLTLLENVENPADVWPAGSLLIVDEATQVSTRDAERLLRYATRTGTVLVLLGDPAQLGSVAAGGWFAHLTAHSPDLPELTTVQRQAGPELAAVRAALGALRATTGPSARAALDQLAAHGRIHLADTTDVLLERAVADWYAERQHTIRAGQADPDKPSPIDADGPSGASSPQAEPSQAGAGAAPTPAELNDARNAPDEMAAGTSSRPESGASAQRAEPDSADDTPTSEDAPGLGASSRTAARRASMPIDRDEPVEPSTVRSAGAGRSRHGARATTQARPVRVHMMAERRHDVDLLNAAARTLLAADDTLTGPVLRVAGREFQKGDDVVTLTQAGHSLIPEGRPRAAYIRTGSVGVVTAVHLADTAADQALEVYFPGKGTARVPWTYLTHRFDDGRDGGLGHAYAITAAKAQGATMDTARAVVPDDTSRPGLYVMLSRARTDLHAYVLRRDDLHDNDDDETWLPALADADSDPLHQLADHLAHTRPERLATDHDPHAIAAHQLVCDHSLADLTALRRTAPGPGDPRGRRDETLPRVPTDTASPEDVPTGHRAPSHGPATSVPASRSDAPGSARAGSGAPEGAPAPIAGSVHPRRRAPNAPEDAPLRTTAQLDHAQRVSRAVEGEPDEPSFAPDAPRHEPRRSGLPWAVLLRRAELAAEAALRADALAQQSAALLERIGPRPPTGPDRAVWDDAVAALAIYRARYTPDAPAGDPGPPPGANPHDRIADPWLRHHDQAVHLAATWAAGLPEHARTRFDSHLEAVPRQRAIGGLHVLLDHGHTADRLETALSAEPSDDARTGAAVLDHRVTALCQAGGLDPTVYDLPTPATAQEDWNTVTRLLRTAEINQLATQPTHTLAAARRALDEQLTQPHLSLGSAGLPDRPQADTLARREALDAALDRQTSTALLRATAEPARYLTDLLGPRPITEPDTSAWDSAAHRVEHYRHHHVGLPYGAPALTDASDPGRRALGNRPVELAAADAYRQALQIGFPHGPVLPL
ncbi:MULTISPECIES: MobF family relaxase [unclassified Frankia]|uniref:MobF family relaxase n=1 Tax=unclassified Frankia TaxID=2632575 RepID=UPI001EE3BDF1|nr:MULTISPECIES: MobF family relaxase [unclassified Frankia]